MPKHALPLALFTIIATAMLALAQTVTSAAAAEQDLSKESIATGPPVYPAACVEQVGEYYGCVHHEDLPEEQARTARGHPLFVEPPMATTTLAFRQRVTSDRDLGASRTTPTHR